ncbi:Putative major facilitator, sugar transporter, major facilitator superfamily [Colletotrichum destructivum]|uniref:Major facilitator, sugar transporter, major facilitator superfamily n=1 Tax=Colletotrichum destructivum TaxID=34406 RepID=A0AAX4IMD7_9PEZI|nr:Putative major facilitator, sugar transporter, major facilitator superfamily [Colletotrichum destructivum]
MNETPSRKGHSKSADPVSTVESQTVPELMKMEHVAYDAQAATDDQKNAGVRQSLREYPKAVGFSMVLSLCIVMEAYDTSLIGNFYGLPQFRRRFGVRLANGDYQLTSTWQSGLQNGTQVGQMIGLFFGGLLAERYGYRKTFLGALLLNIAFVFLFFFARHVGHLLAGGILCGLPWGAFQTLTTTYAADVTPLALRPIMTTYTNMCWVIGQFISTGVLRALLSRPDDWAWRIPYALQWAFPVPILVGVALAPESPTWLVRKGRLTEARRALRRLASTAVSDAQLDVNVAMIAHTNEMERLNQEGTSYADCFRGTNLRRTLIACGTWAGQVLCGIWFGGNVIYFLQQAGFDPDNSFNFGLGTSAMAIVGTLLSWFLLPHVGRRTLYVAGLSVMFVILLTVGGMGVPAPRAGLGWASGALLMLFVVTYDMTVGPVCYCLVAEIPSTRLRIKTVAVARNAYLLVSIGANFLNPPILNPGAWNLRGKGGFIWAGLCFLELAWAYFCLPEPKGRSPAELEMLFEQGVSARKFSSTTVEVFSTGTEKNETPTVDMLENR